jgi:hypothetical protein
MGYANPAEP